MLSIKYQSETFTILLVKDDKDEKLYEQIIVEIIQTAFLKKMFFK